ncbi:MAG: hypothetical protein ACE5GV_00440 [Candidatus Scalindua sp.]
MAYGRRVVFETIREVAFGGIGAAYAALGAVLGDNARIISFSNSTDQEIYISFDGINDHIRLAANSFKLYDLTSNKVRDDGYFLANRTQIYQKRVSGAPTLGSLWAEVIVAGGGV